MTPRLHQFVATALSLIVTLALFSGVSSLSAPQQAGPELAQAPAATATRG